MKEKGKRGAVMIKAVFFDIGGTVHTQDHAGK